jgi:hypothetical protein
VGTRNNGAPSAEAAESGSGPPPGLFGGFSDADRRAVAVFLDRLLASLGNENDDVDVPTVASLIQALETGEETWPVRPLLCTWKIGPGFSSLWQSAIRRFVAVLGQEGQVAAFLGKCGQNEDAWRGEPEGAAREAARVLWDDLDVGEARERLGDLLDPDQYSDLFDLWDYLMACRGDRAAMLRLCRAIRWGAGGLPISAEGRKLARRVADAWESLAHAVGRGPDPITEAERCIRRSGFDLLDLAAVAERLDLRLPVPPGGDGASPAARAAEHWTGATRRVLDAIGDPSSSDGEAARRRYGALLRPLPLRGGGADPDAVWAALRGEFPWMEEANLAVVEAVAMRRHLGAGWFRAQPLLLSGPPGVGKTRWARRAAAILGVDFGMLPLSGASSSMAVTGSERGWRDAVPCYPAALMATVGSANPLVLVDEADKAAEGRHNGNPLDGLLAMLEPETGRRFRDAYLMGHLDLSGLTWVLTVNDVSAMPPPLLSRVRVVRAGKPGKGHFPVLLRGVLADFAAENDTTADRLPVLADEVTGRLESEFGKDFDIRKMKSAVEAELRRAVWLPPGPRLVASFPP